MGEGFKGTYSTKVFKKRSRDIIKQVGRERLNNKNSTYKPFFLFLSFQAPHAPLQAREEILSRIPKTDNPARDIYKAMVLDMDLAVAGIVKALKENDLYDNT